MSRNQPGLHSKNVCKTRLTIKQPNNIKVQEFRGRTETVLKQVKALPETTQTAEGDQRNDAENTMKVTEIT